MFVNVVQFPPIKAGREPEFEEWFAWSNSFYEPFEGFISRRLLKPRRGEGPCLGIVEHESEETFMAMHTSVAREQARRKVAELFDGKPEPAFYDVVVASSSREGDDSAMQNS